MALKQQTTPPLKILHSDIVAWHTGGWGHGLMLGALLIHGVASATANHRKSGNLLGFARKFLGWKSDARNNEHSYDWAFWFGY